MPTETKTDLERQVTRIAKEISQASYDFEAGDYDEPCAGDYLAMAMDTQYIISSQFDYLGSRILVAFGGPNIWINTHTKTVEGYWWSESAFACFDDELGIDEYMSEMYDCSRDNQG